MQHCIPRTNRYHVVDGSPNLCNFAGTLNFRTISKSSMKSAYQALTWGAVVVALMTAVMSIQLSAAPADAATKGIARGWNAPPPPKDDSLTTSLRAAIGDGIKLLASKDNEAFLRRFIPPEQLSNFLSDSTFGDLVEMFAAKKASELLRVLRHVQKRKATFTADDGQTVATYKYSPKISKRTKILFLYIEGVWYIGN